MLLVIGGDIFIGDEHAGAKTLIDEPEHGELPEEVVAELIFTQVKASELALEARFVAAETIAPELIEEGGDVLFGRLRVVAVEQILADELLIDEAIGSAAHGGGAAIPRLAIEER